MKQSKTTKKLFSLMITFPPMYKHVYMYIYIYYTASPGQQANKIYLPNASIRLYCIHSIHILKAGVCLTVIIIAPLDCKLDTVGFE